MTLLRLTPMWLYEASLDLLMDALIDYPYGVNAGAEAKIEIRNELLLRAVWAD